MSQVNTALAAIPLFDAAVIHGVRVVRRSLLGFQIAEGGELLTATEVAARLAAAPNFPVPGGARRVSRVPRPGQSVRVLLCSRCGGDGLGRRNRGSCGLCHGPGIQVILPTGGFAKALPEELAAAVTQALGALRLAPYPRARESLAALLDEAMPFTPAELRERAQGELQRAGFEGAAEAISARGGEPRAA